eukprot:TRINITY_DN14863_c0_g1_i1.p1 TRINITY_DN14863_c0_g1~~TRINITY_DN14863_c0_g1_i1.p1  ORF type:complete len:345 (+),score=101.51 TRINITY_DN14863_c0_g1_i1:89-1123(+)
MPGKKGGSPKPPPVEKKVGLGGTTFGGFQDSNFISLEDPYEKRIPVPSRHLGAPEGKPKWTPVPPMREGRTPDVYFDKETRRMGEKDEFFDPGFSKKEREERAGAKKAILQGPWKNPNPTKLTTGPGTIFGTFQEPGVLKGKPFPHEPEFAVPKKDDVPSRAERQPKNIIVPCSKVGGFGVQAAGLYFSNPEGVKDDNKRDKFDAQKERDRKESEDHKKKILAPDRPFKSASKTRYTFDEQVSGVSKIYTNDKKLPDIREKKKDEKKDDKPAFRYSSPAKYGEQGCLAKYTTRLEGKIDKYDQKVLDERDARKKAPKNVGSGPWMPTPGPKVGCTKSLLKIQYH